LAPGTSASTSRRTEGTHGFASFLPTFATTPRAAVEILVATACASPSSRVTSAVLQSDFEFTFIPVSGAASATEKTSRISSERAGKGVAIKSQLTVGLPHRNGAVAKAERAGADGGVRRPPRNLCRKETGREFPPMIGKRAPSYVNRGRPANKDMPCFHLEQNKRPRHRAKKVKWRLGGMNKQRGRYCIHSLIRKPSERIAIRPVNRSRIVVKNRFGIYSWNRERRASIASRGRA